mgnify:FL=1
MNQVLRAFTATIDDVNKKDRTIVAKVGTGDLDRYATVIDPKGIDLRAYLANPVVLFSHGSDPVRGSLPIGRNLWIKVDRSGNGRLIAKTQFRDDEFSRNLYDCYKEGWMRGWSVSILPKEFGPPTQEQIRSRQELKACEIFYSTSELAEYSAVSVPGNGSALSDDELRSLSNVISRGIPLPADVLEAVERLAKVEVDQDRAVEEISEDRMSSCDGASGGYLIKPEEKDEEDRDKPADEDKEKKKKSEEDEKPGDEADGDEDDKPKGSERSLIEVPVVVESPIIELPDISNARTFAQIYHLLRNEEIQHREMVLKKIDEAINWYHGKV